MNSHAAAIVFDQVEKDFPRTGKVIAGLDLEIPAGQFVALLGPSGSGKTTLLRLVAGLEQPTRGEVRVPDAASRNRGYVFQEAHLMPWRSVFANVALPLEILGRTRKEIREQVEAALALVGLESARDLLPHALSGGMRMRVSVARALVSKPGLLLLDEPFSALDETTRFRLATELRRIWLAAGMTVVFVTHSLAEAVFVADRAVVFSQRPLRILADLRIPLGTERPDRLRVSPAYAELLARIYEIVAENGDEHARQAK